VKGEEMAGFIQDRTAENTFHTVGDAKVQTMVSCPFYTVKKICLKGEAELSMEGDYQLFSVIGGNGHVDGTPVKKGDHFILPTGYGTYKLSGEMELMISFAEGENNI
jgi:mannose-6-phosphate isomerase class I